MTNISKLPVESHCTKCGALFHSTSKFCGFDGTQLARCDAANYSQQPLSGKQCPTCATKYSTAKQFCGVDGTALVPWYDAGSQFDNVKEDSSSSEPGSVSASAELPRAVKSTLEILAHKPGLPTREQNWNFAPASHTSHEPTSSSKPRDVHNLSLVDFQKVTEALILEHAQNADKSKEQAQPTGDAQTGEADPARAEFDAAHKPATTEIPAEKLSQVDLEVVTESLTIDQFEISTNSATRAKQPSIELPPPIPSDKLSKVDFEMVTEWLTVDQSEQAAEAARQIQSRKTHIEPAEIGEQVPIPIAEAEAEAEAEKKYIRPEDLNNTVESAATQVEKAEKLPEEPSRPLRPDNSFADDLKLIGQTLEGKYAITSVLAEGGMAILYLANHTTMERTVVVKVVHNYLRSSKSELERFEREAKTVARLNHPNIVSLYDFGFIEDQLPFIVMEYIRGMNLAQKVIRHGPPRIAVASRIIKQICHGLEEAHRCGIIHRDLKPDNIILQDKFDRPDWVKLVDFGIAHMLDDKGKRLTRAGLLIGTPEYCSPEQFKDLPLDTRSDIYSLGVVLFEMFTGRLPYEAGNLAALMTKILLEPAPSICLYRDDIESGSAIDLLIQKCLEKEPEDRFQTVKEVRLAAEAAYDSEYETETVAFQNNVD